MQISPPLCAPYAPAPLLCVVKSQRSNDNSSPKVHLMGVLMEICAHIISISRAKILSLQKSFCLLAGKGGNQKIKKIALNDAKDGFIC